MQKPVKAWVVAGAILHGGTRVLAGCGSSFSSGESLESDCESACNKVASACAISASDCLNSCEDTSGFPLSCLSYVDSLTSCAATTGTVTCQTGAPARRRP